MKLTLAILILPVILFAAGDKKETAPKPNKRQPLTLPAEAVKIEPFTYRYKDPDGKVWIYRQIPFGLVRYEEKAASVEAGSKKDSSATPLKAFDEGDEIRFERQGPFGAYTWRRKKGELTQEEKEALEKARQRKAPADKSKQE